MTHQKYCKFFIIITENYQFQCSIQYNENNNNQKKVITINNQQNDYLPLSIQFDMNEIYIGNQNENSIDFMKDWIEQSQDYKEYKIEFQNKEYFIVSEVLLALLINEFKEQIEKEFIIEETIYELPESFSIKRTTLSILFPNISLRS